MKISDNVLTAVNWGKSHRLLLLSLLFILFVIVIDWYYVNAMKPVSQVESENIHQAAPSIPASVDNGTSANSSSVQSIIQSDESSPVKTSVRINGEQMPVPQTGTTHKVIQDDNGTTTIDISVDSSTVGGTSTNSSTTNSSTNIQLNSTSEIDSSIESSN